MGADEDIATSPLLYTWAPHPEDDSPVRQVQHWLFWLPFSSLFALWRYASVTDLIVAVKEKRPNAEKELACLVLHWVVMLLNVPLPVLACAVLLSGFVSSTIVTATHQSEELFGEFQDDWVTSQFRSTRSAVTRTPFTEWLWGGMQYQLEHHLFPSMPRSKYPALAEVLRKFAAENDIPGGYRAGDEVDLVVQNWATYRDVALGPQGGLDSPRVRDEEQVTGVGYQFAMK